MAEFSELPTVTVQATMRLSEQELGALDALACYGDDAFLEAFKAKLGSCYIRDYEEGLRTLLKSVRRQVPSILERARDARKVFTNGKPAVT